jgi:hypothetical protein
MAIPATRNVPIRGPRNPPVSFCVKPTCGLIQISSGRRYRMPWTARKTTIATVTAQKRRPRNQAKASPARSVKRHEALDSTARLVMPRRRRR